MKKIILFCFCFFSINAFSMSDYELCKMLEESGDPNETIKYIGESYLEGKNAKENAQVFLNYAISQAVLYSDPFMGSRSFIPTCLKELKKVNNDGFFGILRSN